MKNRYCLFQKDNDINCNICNVNINISEIICNVKRSKDKRVDFCKTWRRKADVSPRSAANRNATTATFDLWLATNMYNIDGSLELITRCNRI